MDKACIARLWQAAAEGLPIPAECIAYVTTHKLASHLVFVAVWNDNRETVLKLLELLSDVLFPSGYTAQERVNGLLSVMSVNALCCAAMKGSIRTARLLLQANADVNYDCGYGGTPMWFAACADQPDFVRFLVDAHADLNVVDDEVRTPLAYAATFGCVSAVSTLLELKAHDSADRNGWTPLMYAAKNREVSCARLLIEARAQVNAIGQDPEQHNDLAPLLRAASNGDLAMASLLVEAKAVVNIGDAERRTPLSFAAAQGHIAMGQLLLGAKADVDAPRHRPAIQEATARGHADMVQLLLGAKACLSLATGGGPQ